MQFCKVHKRNLGNTAPRLRTECGRYVCQGNSYKYKQWCKRNHPDKQKDDMEEENKEAATTLIKEFGLIKKKQPVADAKPVPDVF